MTQSGTLAGGAAVEVRAELGRQQKSASALAKDLGVSDMYMSRRLNGHVPFDLAEIEKVAAVLGVPVQQFLGGHLSDAATGSVA
jgi:transcriptional regulator with XRE-family HTH domain